MMISHDEAFEQIFLNKNSLTSAQKFAERPRIDPSTTPTAKINNLTEMEKNNHEEEIAELKKQLDFATKNAKSSKKISIATLIISAIAALAAVLSLFK